MGLDTEDEDIHSLPFADDQVIIAQDQCLSVYMRQKILKDNTKR
jgi:hypothetical protein